MNIEYDEPSFDEVQPPQGETLLYLDFDGVLNDNFTAPLPKEFLPPALKDSNFDGLKPALVGLLNRILFETNAKVILSTSWFRWLGLDGCLKVLRYYGFKGEVVGATPRKMTSNEAMRPHEINWSLQDRKPKHWVILDDAESVKRDKRLWIAKHLIGTDPRIGLEDIHVKLAIDILSREHPRS